MDLPLSLSFSVCGCRTNRHHQQASFCCCSSCCWCCRSVHPCRCCRCSCFVVVVGVPTSHSSSSSGLRRPIKHLRTENFPTFQGGEISSPQPPRNRFSNYRLLYQSSCTSSIGDGPRTLRTIHIHTLRMGSRGFSQSVGRGK